MKKKLLSAAVVAAMLASMSGAVIADATNPAVFVDGGEIFFEDQKAEILGEGTTLVPARGVFEAMGAKVTWDGDTRLVEVTSSDNKTVIRLTIDDSTMRVYDVSGIFAAAVSGQDFVAPETDVVLDVAPQIINDRTMIPLRAISEALNADVQCDFDAYEINITTPNASKVEDGIPTLSLSADSLTAAEGENVDIYINVADLPSDVYVSGVTATVKYDPENFEFVETTLMNGDAVIENAMGESNAQFTDGYLKTNIVTIDEESAAKTDGVIMKITFKSLTGKEGTFSLSNGYHTTFRYNTSLMVSANSTDKTLSGNKLAIDTTELIINGADAEATVEPTATAEPEATVEPEATTDPTATAEPEATAEPTATPAA